MHKCHCSSQKCPFGKNRLGPGAGIQSIITCCFSGSSEETPLVSSSNQWERDIYGSSIFLLKNPPVSDALSPGMPPGSKALLMRTHGPPGFHENGGLTKGKPWENQDNEGFH